MKPFTFEAEVTDDSTESGYRTEWVDMPEVITTAFLETLGACPVGIRDFARQFPVGVKFTKANIAKAIKAHLPVKWLAMRIPAVRAHYEKAIEKKSNAIERALAKRYGKQWSYRDAAVNVYYRRNEKARHEVLAEAFAPVLRHFERQHAKAKAAKTKAKAKLVARAVAKARRKISAKGRTRIAA